MMPSIFDYLPEHAEALWKTAAEKSRESEIKRKAKVIGKGLLALGGGMAAGVGAGVLLDKMSPSSAGEWVKIAPVLSAMGGVAYGVHKHFQDKELARDG